jgi:hypothetical protein
MMELFTLEEFQEVIFLDLSWEIISFKLMVDFMHTIIKNWSVLFQAEIKRTFLKDLLEI